MVFSPCYENYTADAILSGAEPIYVPLVPPEYHFDSGALRSALEDGAKAIVLCNPANPTGKVYTREELSEIASLAQERRRPCRKRPSQGWSCRILTASSSPAT